MSNANELYMKYSRRQQNRLQENNTAETLYAKYSKSQRGFNAQKKLEEQRLEAEHQAAEKHVTEKAAFE